ncbi:hypothetical protein [Mucilaginibacter paludis]|uniref:Uncharacterized protein n=1 Tax=Mucilaginibacter paludis DSM 18603 TaxID=714943 RepID=H1Y4F4_9SPHI|nr:hypothetical protein [Mucilaginibacter paludis]EHQ25788.1 hypothetical protein Mucpa_1631 [Mucilaginibacter paludis DSM 18603]
MKNYIYSIAAMVMICGIVIACKKSEQSGSSSGGTKTTPVTTVMGAPPATWKEHCWGGHTKLVSLAYYNDDLALYYDDGMDQSIQWFRSQYTLAWRYVKKTYGNYGDSSRLYMICHGIPPNASAQDNSYGGGHPGTYYDETHNYRNTTDCGLGVSVWAESTGDAIREPIHEIGHIVASSSYGMKHDISSGLWGDSKFAEIFIYDVLMNINRQPEAQDIFNQMQTQYDDFPAPNTQWFKNWFYPIYNKYGQGAVLAKYFKQLSDNAHDRSEALNLGEFVHFFSGAAGVNLNDQAKIAFGTAWNDTAIAQFKKAQAIYPNVKYPY